MNSGVFSGNLAVRLIWNFHSNFGFRCNAVLKMNLPVVKKELLRQPGTAVDVVEDRYGLPDQISKSK